MTASGEVEFCNQRILDFFGKTLEEFRDWAPLLHPDDLASVLAKWSHSVQTGQPYEAEFRVRRADGEYRWFQSRGLPLRDTAGRIIRWHNLLIDIDDRRKAEETERARERELALIVETLPGLVWCASPEGELTYANQRLLEYFGTSQEEFSRAGWDRFFHSEDRDSVNKAWSSAVRTFQPFEVQARLRRADGFHRWVHSVGRVGRDREGHPTRWYGLLVDIDDLKNMDEVLRSTQASLSRAMQIATMGQLSACIAHEVNQPLAAIVANGHACLRWLSAGPPNVAKAQEAAERVVRDGKEAGEIIRRVRALFNRTTIERVPLDLNDIIDEALRLLRGETAKRCVLIDTDLLNIPYVLGDRIQLQQLFVNLVANSLEAMDPVVDRPRILRIRSKQDSADSVLVEIQDSGVGLSDPDKSFEAFFTTKENGMGMGLAICRSIVDAHDGRIWASSGVGSGTALYFTLPAQTNAAI